MTSARRTVRLYFCDSPKPTIVRWGNTSGNSYSSLLQRFQDAKLVMPDGSPFSKDSSQVKVQVDGQWTIPEKDDEMPMGSFDVQVSKPTTGVGSPEDLKQVIKALKPVTQVCMEKLYQTRYASTISKDDLREVRSAYKTILQVKGTENEAPVRREEYWNERHEVQAVDDYMKTIKGWAPNRRILEFRDARGHVVRSTAAPLNFPIASSNDVVLIRRGYSIDPEVGCVLGVEMKRGITAKGLRQAELEFYLWGLCSLFPFVQIITDMQTGGAAFYETENTPGGHHIIVKQNFDSMDSVRDFVRGVIASIPEDIGQDGPDGKMVLPSGLRNPERKRRREDTPEPRQGGAVGHQEIMCSEKRGFKLMGAMSQRQGMSC